VSDNVVIFAIIFAVAILFFAWSCFKRFRLVLLGKAENRFNNIGKRIWNMLSYAFGQRRVVSRPFGVNHFILFWCFLVLLIANAEFLLHGLFPEFIRLSLLPDGAYYTLAFIFDIVSILALLSVLIAFGRRLFFPPKYIEARSRDAFIILSLVGMLMIAFFGLHGSEIAHSAPLSDMSSHKIMLAAQFMPISNFVGTVILSGSSPSTQKILIDVFWWIHAIVLLVFLNYLPYSKHMHILTSIFNCFFKSIDKDTTPRGV
jgi:hypothetical protein